MVNTENKLPESVTLKLEYKMTLEEMTEYMEIPIEDINIEVMIGKLREYVSEACDFNAIQFAPIYDDNGTLVSGDE